ncbi:hypothetical protein FBQ81_05530 [Chloroflexi bacterium CFX6]|nr:hypothetical protein [Chloroflexi bacterium CFX6]
MNELGLILLVIFLVYLITSIIFLWVAKRKEIDKITAHTLQTYAPRIKRPYFSIHSFSSGWEAKKSPAQFIFYLIISPFIFFSWLAWRLFGKDKPDDFERTFPPRHPGGRDKGRRNKKFADADDRLLSLMVEKRLDFEPAFWEMRKEYWEIAYPDQSYQNPAKLKTIERATKRRIDNLLLTKN